MGTRPMPEVESIPGARLRAARRAAGLTQAALAGRLGITKAYVCQVERGYRTPTLDWLRDTARAIGCDPASLDPDLASRATDGASKVG